jgi:hypothetical protein
MTRASTFGGGCMSETRDAGAHERLTACEASLGWMPRGMGGQDVEGVLDEHIEAVFLCRGCIFRWR